MNRSFPARIGQSRLFGTLALLVAFCIVTGLALPAWSESSYCSGSDDDNAPDFSDNDDILNGRRYLANKMDLVAAMPVYGDDRDEDNICDVDSSQTALANYIRPTSDNEVSGGYKDCIGSTTETDVTSFQYTARGARLAEFSYDFLVTLEPDFDSDTGMYLLVQDCSDGCSDLSSTYVDASDQTEVQMAVADFDADGFDEILVISAEQAQVYYASDTSSGFDGTLSSGNATSLGSTYAPYGAPTVGDFNNDGNWDVAWISDGEDGDSLTVYIATVCAGDIDDTVCDGQSALDVIFSSGSDDSISLDANDSKYCRDLLIGSLAAGDFVTSSDGDELVVAYCERERSRHGHVKLAYYDFEDDDDYGLHPVQEVLIQADSLDYTHAILVRAGNLDWFEDTNQIVLAYGGEGSSNHKVFVSLWEVDVGSGSASLTSLCDKYEVKRSHKIALAGLALGRFTTDSSDASDYDLSVAFLWSHRNTDAEHTQYELYDTFLTVFDDSGDFDLEYASQNQLQGPFGGDFESDYVGSDRLWPADLQGQGTRLGEPEVVRVINQVQPHVILGAPPMHVDWIMPDSSTADSTSLFNLTAVPDAFNSSYDMDSSDSSQSSTTSKTSYSHSYTETVEGKKSFKVPYVSSISASTKNSTAQAHSSYVSTTYDTYKSVSYDASTTTSLGDEVWFQQFDLALYYYPVIGEYVCPSDVTDCCGTDDATDDCTEPSEPLYVVYSGTSQICTTAAQGKTMEWYQPYTEPGNIFSFPWSLDMLESQVDGLDLLSDTVNFFTGDNSSSESVTWSETSGESTSTGSTNTNSFDTTNSISGGSEKTSLKVSVSYSRSRSVETLGVNETVMGSSTGVEIVKEEVFQSDDLYQYEVMPYIFGQALPDGTEDDSDACTDIDTCVSSTGTLRVGFAVDPNVSGSGTWWADSDYNDYNDISLNHPQRWWFKENTSCDSLNCLASSEGDSGTTTCMRFNQTTTEDDEVWSNEFFSLRGLLVQVDTASGPQMVQATEGDDVFLTARVYNYSFLDVDEDDTLHVRFYRQEWDSTNNEPVEGIDSVLIAEETLDMSDTPLPGFNSESGPNYQEVTTTFDTSDLGDTYQVFWVLVWATDASGDLVSELPGHGLTALPDTLDSISFVTDVVPILDTASWTESDSGDSTYDCVDTTYDDIPFSNNVGVLKMAFYIAAADEDETSSAAVAMSASPAASQEAVAVRAPPLDLQDLKVYPSAVFLNERVIVEGAVTANGAAAEGVMVAMFDDEPVDGGTVQDMELLSRIGVGETYNFRMPFRPRAAAEHQMVLVAAPGTSKETVGRVPLEVLSEATALERASGWGQTGAPGTLSLMARVALARDDFSLSDLNLRRATLWVESLLREGGNELFAGSYRQWEPFTMFALRGPYWDPHKGSAHFFGTNGTTSAWARLRIRDGRGILFLVARGEQVSNPAECEYPDLVTELDTRLVLDDGRNEPVLMRLGDTWKCTPRRNGTANLTRRP